MPMCDDSDLVHCLSDGSGWERYEMQRKNEGGGYCVHTRNRMMSTFAIYNALEGGSGSKGRIGRESSK